MIDRSEQSPYAVHREYEGLDDLFSVQTSQANATHATALAVDNGIPAYGSSEWYGGHVGKKACREFHAKGWPEGLAKLRETLGILRLDTRPTSIRRRGSWTNEGDEVCMERVYLGNLDTAWHRVSPRQANGPSVVRLFVRIGANASVSPEQLFWSGAVALTLCDALEEAGYAVEIVGFSESKGVYSDEKLSLFTVKVKGSDEPLNMTRLAATTAHVGTFRIGLFGAYLSVERRVSDFLGSQCKGRLAHAEAILEPGDLELNRAYSADEAKAEIKRVTELVNSGQMALGHA